MPNGSGFDLATYVEKEKLSLKVVLTSGFADTRDPALEYRALTENMLHKPCSRDALLRKVRAVLDRGNRSPGLATGTGRSPHRRI